MYQIMFTKEIHEKKSKIIPIDADIGKDGRICGIEIHETESWPKEYKLNFKPGLTSFENFTTYYELDTTRFAIFLHVPSETVRTIDADMALLLNTENVIIGLELSNFSAYWTEHISINGLGKNGDIILM